MRWGDGPLVRGEGEGAAEAFDVADFVEVDAEEVEVWEGEHEAAGGELVEVAGGGGGEVRGVFGDEGGGAGEGGAAEEEGLGAAVVGVVDEERAERVEEEELFVSGEGGEVEEGVAEVG